MESPDSLESRHNNAGWKRFQKARRFWGTSEVTYLRYIPFAFINGLLRWQPGRASACSFSEKFM
jgi:hypothetical protein